MTNSCREAWCGVSLYGGDWCNYDGIDVPCVVHDLHERNERLQAENERLHGVLEDMYAYLRTIDYRDDVFEQVAPLERVLREAVSK